MLVDGDTVVTVGCADGTAGWALEWAVGSTVVGEELLCWTVSGGGDVGEVFATLSAGSVGLSDGSAVVGTTVVVVDSVAAATVVPVLEAAVAVVVVATTDAAVFGSLDIKPKSS